MVLLSAEKTTAKGTFYSGFPVTWTWESGTVTITAVTGTAAATDYDLTLWMAGG